MMCLICSISSINEPCCGAVDPAEEVSCVVRNPPTERIVTRGWRTPHGVRRGGGVRRRLLLFGFPLVKHPFLHKVCLKQKELEFFSMKLLFCGLFPGWSLFWMKPPPKPAAGTARCGLVHPNQRKRTSFCFLWKCRSLRRTRTSRRSGQTCVCVCGSRAPGRRWHLFL